jgi:hypothetical protein
LREYLDQAYGALLSYEGRPGDYQVARINALEQDLKAVEDRTRTLVDRDLPKLNESLRKRGLESITLASADREGARFAALKALEEGTERVAVGTAREERD